MNNNLESEKVRKMIMRPLLVIKVVFVSYALFSLLCPAYSPSDFLGGFKYSIVCIGFLFYGVLGAVGLVEPSVPLMPFCVVKSIQLIVALFIQSSYKINWISFVINCAIGLTLCILLMIDRGRFYYEEEDYNGNI